MPLPWHTAERRLVRAGVTGLLVGFLGGAVVGSHLERRYWPCSCDDPGLAGLLYGGAVGTAVSVPTAVHLANGRRGSYVRTLGASLLVGAVGLAGLHATSDSDAEAAGFFFLAPPLLEIAVSVAVELSHGGDGSDQPTMGSSTILRSDTVPPRPGGTYEQ